jgi:hypothetical protein
MISCRPLILILLIFLFSCNKQSREWETEWAVPVCFGRFDVESFVSKDHLAIDEFGWYHYVLDTTITDVSFSEVIDIHDTIIHKSIQIPVDINVPPNTLIWSQTQQESWLNTGEAALRRLVLNGGILSYKITSQVQGTLNVEYLLPDVIKNGNALSINRLVPGGTPTLPGFVTGEISLTDCDINLSGSTGFSINDLQSILTIRTPSNTTGNAIAQAGSEVGIELSFLSPSVAYAQGFFGSSVQDINVDLDWSSRFPVGIIRSEGWAMNMNFTNLSGVDLIFSPTDMSFISTGTSNPVSLVSSDFFKSYPIARAVETENGGVTGQTVSMNVNPENSNINNILQNIPSRLIFNGSLNVNPIGNVSSYHDFIYTNRPFEMNLKADLPMRFCLGEVESTIELPVQVSSLSGKASLSLTYVNSFPISLLADIGIENKTGFTRLAQINIAPGQLHQDLVHIDPIDKSVNIILSRSQLQEIEEHGKLTIKLKLNTQSYPSMIGLRPEYYLEFKSHGVINIDHSI